MAQFRRSLVPVMLLACLVLSHASGCAVFSDLKKERESPKALPGSLLAQKSEDFLYDKSVRAYRYLPKETRQPGTLKPGTVVRDPVGRKIQHEEDLQVLFEPIDSRFSTGETVTMWTGVGIAGAAAVAGVIVFFPCVVAMSVVGLVLGIPSLPVSTSLEATYVTEAQQAYMQGRTEFLAGSYERALASWDHAEEIMPSLRAYSDVNYWRGRTFDALARPRVAAIAYGDFLAYSESVVPSYFKPQLPDDSSWTEKADRAEARSSEVMRDSVKRAKAVAARPGGALYE